MKETLTVKVEVSGIDEATEKAEKLVETIKEAKTLADELASMEIDINL